MTHWSKEIDRASKKERGWRSRGQKVIDRYLDKRKGADHIYAEDSKTKFNILWSNTETLRPALISSTPLLSRWRIALIRLLFFLLPL